MNDNLAGKVLDVRKFIDFEHCANEMEERADRFAKNTLLNPTEYKKFIDRRDFSLEAIEDFADKYTYTINETSINRERLKI